MPGNDVMSQNMSQNMSQSMSQNMSQNTSQSDKLKQTKNERFDQVRNSDIVRGQFFR